MRPGAPTAWSRWMDVAILAVVTGLAYANSLGVPLHMDDIHFIVDDPEMTDPWRVLARTWTERRLVPILSFALQYQVHGDQVLDYHVVNLLIHVLMASAVYALTSLTLRLALAGDPRRDAVTRWTALVTAGLFALHPLQTQAVTYIVQRMTSLAALFSIATLLAYARHRLSATPTARAWWLAAAVVACALAMRTKENAAVLPGLVLLYEVAFLRNGARRRLLSLAAVASPLLLLAITFLPSIASPGAAPAALDAAMRAHSTLPRHVYFLTELPVVLRYMRLLLVPIGQNIDPDVPVYRSFHPSVALSLVALLLVVVVAIAALRTARRGEVRVAGFGLLFFLVALSVESSVFPLADVMTEHRVYLPSVGFLMAITAPLCAWVLRSGRATASTATAALSLVLLALFVGTVARNAVWRRPLTLWADATEKSPFKARPRVALATHLAERGDLEGARRQLETVLAQHPRDARALGQMGNLAWAVRDLQGARHYWERCVMADPGLAGCHYNLGGVLEMLGEKERALYHYRRFLESNPPPELAGRAAWVRKRFHW